MRTKDFIPLDLYDLDLGPAIRYLRREKEMSTSTLSKLSGVSEDYIRELERNKHGTVPSIACLKQLDKGLLTKGPMFGFLLLRRTRMIKEKAKSKAIAEIPRCRSCGAKV